MSMLKKMLDKILHDTVYAIGYRKYGTDTPFRIIKSNWRYWYADPLMFEHNGELWLFAEKMDRIKHKGVISASKYQDGFNDEFEDVLEEKFHLSYPMVFKKDGKFYMIPETSDVNGVLLYESSRFPFDWQQKYTLLHGEKYVDTNVFEVNGHWYLITCIMNPKMGACTKLMVYSADNIDKGVLSPLDSFNYSSKYCFDCRGGGQIFYQNSKIYRPVQCGNELEYGKYLDIETMKVSDKCVSFNKEYSIMPDDLPIDRNKNIIGTHTYGICVGIEIIDLKIREVANPIVHALKIYRKLFSKH